MKYVARVTQLLRTGVHALGELRDGEVHRVAYLPRPDRLEVELEGGPEQPCMMYRYTDAGEFCGDTWHETLRDAFAQANDEYGLSEGDFRLIDQ